MSWGAVQSPVWPQAFGRGITLSSKTRRKTTGHMSTFLRSLFSTRPSEQCDQAGYDPALFNATGCGTGEWRTSGDEYSAALDFNSRRCRGVKHEAIGSLGRDRRIQIPRSDRRRGRRVDTGSEALGCLKHPGGASTQTPHITIFSNRMVLVLMFQRCSGFRTPKQRGVARPMASHPGAPLPSPPGR